MGRPPSNGGPSFRFNQAEIAEMEAILQAHRIAMPERQVLVSLAEKFSKSEERLGKIEVQMKQVWNWFQNRRYAIRAKAAKTPGKLNMTHMAPVDSSMVKSVPQVTQPHAAPSANVRTLPQAPQHPTVPSASVRTFPQAPQQLPAFSGRVADNSQMEYEAKSARDGAWYDVATFLSHRSLETGDPEVLVRFAGFGAEEDEWVNVRKNVRQRSLPCEASECVAVLPSDLILCFQEGKEQALYFDAHVLDTQRRRHDVRGCRCRFLVRYDHDQSEEIVALRKICRRPESDYRLQQLHAVNESIMANQNKNGANNNNIHTVSTLRVYPPAEVQPKQHKVEPTVPPSPIEAPQKRQRLDSTGPPEGSQTQINVEPVMANVPQNQPAVQPAVSAPGRGAEPVVLSQSDQTSLEREKVQPAVHVLSVQGSDEVSVGLQKIPVDSHEFKADVPCSVEAKQELQSEDHNKAEPVPSGEVPEAVGFAIPPSAGAPHEGEPELAELQKESVVSGCSVKVTAELHDVQSDAPDQPHKSTLETKTEKAMLSVSVNQSNVVEEAIDTKTEDPVVFVSSNDPIVVQEIIETIAEEPVMLVSSNDPNVVHAAKTEEPVVPVDSNVVHAAKTKEPVVPVDSNVVHEAKTEEPVVPVDSNVVDEAKTEEPVVPVDSNVIQEAKTEELVLPVDSSVLQEAKNVEHVVPVDPNVAQEAKTEKHVVPVDSNVVQEPKTEEPVVPVDSNVVQEAKTEEPVAPVDSDVAQDAKTEEHVVSVDPNVTQEAKTEEHVVSVDPNVTQEAKIEERVVSVDPIVTQETITEEPMVPVNDSIMIEANIEHAEVSEMMETNKDELANVAENVSDSKVENMDITSESGGVAMEEG